MLYTFILQDLPGVPEFCNWRDAQATELIRKWIRLLRNMLVFLSYFLARTTTIQQVALSATIWMELHRNVSRVLKDGNDIMRRCAFECGFPLYNVGDPTPRARTPEATGPEPAECPICMDLRPSIALVPCGHTFCHPCIERYGRCPTCNQLIHEKMFIYF